MYMVTRYYNLCTSLLFHNNLHCIDQIVLVTLINDMRTQFEHKRFHSPENLESIWQLLYPEHFINVLLIHHLKRREEKEILGVANIMKRGLMYESTNDPKKSHEISDIFKPFQSEDGSATDPKLILINGAPGMGKTTLCKEIAYRWANKKLLLDTKVVFLLFLRDPAVHKMQDLKGFIHYFYKFNPSFLDLSMQCEEILKTRDNSDITILMDGYDEFNDKDNNSLIKNIIERDILPQCRIVITSRPIASENLQKLADVRVEVLGFTPQSRKEYIEKELKEYPEKIESLLHYLSNHSDISRVCYIPIMMTIMVCTFKEIEELPTNQSELYERFITLAVSRCVQKLDKTSILSLNRLPKKYQQYLHLLSEFAFKTIEDEKIVFSDMDIERLSPTLASSSKEYQGLGLLRATEHLSIKKMENCIWYNFLHLSIHEFLAAYYLKTLQPCEQFKILKRAFFIKRYINVWSLFVGLQRDVTYDFHHFLTYCYIQEASDTVKDYVMSLLQTIHLLNFSEIKILKLKRMKGIFQLFCSKNDMCTDGFLTYDIITNFDTTTLLQFNWCPTNLFASLCNTGNSDQLIEIYFSDKNTKFYTYYRLIEALKENQNLSVLLLSSSTLVGYRSNYHQLTNALNINKSLERITLRYCLINKDIANTMSSYLKNSHCLKGLSITNSKLSNNPTFLTVILQTLKESYNLKVLDFQSTSLTVKETEELAIVIKNNPGLKELYLFNSGLKTSAAVILKALKEKSVLTKLHLDNNLMTEELAEDLAAVIENNSSLEELSIGKNKFGLSAGTILQALQKHSRLKVLSLSDNNLTAHVAEELATMINNNLGLKELYIHDNDFQTSVAIILKALKEISTLTKLYLNNSLITKEAAEDLANTIKNNTNLQELRIDNNNLGLSAAPILQALKDNCNLKKLNLENNNMTEQVAEDLANVIKNNQSLEELYLSNNNFKTSVAVILKALKEKSVLKKLRLSKNLMTKEAVEDLSDVIKNNTHLEQLYVADNKLGIQAAVILQALSNSSKIKSLNLSNNSMTEQLIGDLINVIRNNLDLEELYLYNNDLRSSAFKILQALKEKSILTILHLNNNLMTGEVAEDLAAVIENNSSLEELSIGKNKFGLSAGTILQALQKHSRLKVLNLSDNNLTAHVAEELATMINNNLGLEELYIYDNDFQTSVAIILKALKEISTLTRLYLNNSLMTEEAAEDLANIIKNNTNLQELRIDNNNLGLSAAPILKALKGNCNLKMLNLENNDMTEQVAEDLANVIKNNQSLEQLYLSNNNFKTSVAVILKALKEKSVLTKLNLNKNLLTGEVAEDLAAFIKNNSSLEWLCIESNRLGLSAAMVLQALQEHSRLKALNLSDNKLTAHVAEELASVLENNPSLEDLRIRNNMLGTSTVKVLQALSKISKLKTLNLISNNLTGQVSQDLAKVININSDLENFYLSDTNLKSSAVVIVQALKQNSQLNILYLCNFLTESVIDELVSIIKNNPLITELWLGNNLLQSGLIDIAKTCNNLTNLHALELSCNNINSMEVVNLVPIIGKLNSLQVLILGGLIFDVKERLYSHLCNIMKQKFLFQRKDIDNEILKEMCLEMWRSQFVGRTKLNHYLTDCFFKDVINVQMIPFYAQKLSTALLIVEQSEKKLSQLDATNIIISLSVIIKPLIVLDLEYSNINKEAAVELERALNCNNVLKQFWLKGNVLGADGAAVILSSLQNMTTLRVLDLSYNNISSRSANGIAAVINSNHFLEQLWLDGNMLMTTGVVIIAKALKKHSNLTLLSLSNNEITEDAAEEISAIVSSKNLLRGLLLSNNQLQSMHLSEITKSHGGIHFLHILELSNNFINTTAADELAVTLSSCVSLKELYLGNNNLGTTGVVKIFQAVKNITILQVLSLNNNNITTEAASEICDVINTNTNLDILLLGGNDLQTSGVLQIADTVKNNNPTMQLLSLSDNNVDEQVKEDIKVMLCDQCDLELFI